jgi:hypothetical protein
MKRALALAVLAITLVLTSTARAQDGIDVRSSSATNDFPNGIAFSLDVATDATLDDVRLIYEIAPDGVRTTAEPACTGGAVVSCRFQLAGGQRALLIPGAEVTYFWSLTAGGATVDTDRQTVVYEDDRFDWQTVSDGNLTLWYYGDQDDARAVLAAGRESLDRISALLQTTVDFPVKIRFYESAQEMQQAIISNNAEGVVTLGEVFYSDTAMVSADSVPQDIARHEIAHVVVRHALRAPFDVPDWLNEGLAVFAQSQPLSSQREAIEDAIRSGEVLSVRSLSSASAGALGSRVSLYYGQSWSTVKFLIDTYGDAKFADLFRAYAGGATTTEALEQVYGFNQDGLENAWRESVGLPPREAPTPDPHGAVEPTQAPPGDGNGAAQPGDDDGAPIVLIAIIAVLTVVLAGALVGAGLVLARRYR